MTERIDGTVLVQPVHLIHLSHLAHLVAHLMVKRAQVIDLVDLLLKRLAVVHAVLDGLRCCLCCGGMMLLVSTPGVRIVVYSRVARQLI